VVEPQFAHERSKSPATGRLALFDVVFPAARALLSIGLELRELTDGQRFGKV
jgi:hypothetical protein